MARPRKPRPATAATPAPAAPINPVFAGLRVLRQARSPATPPRAPSTPAAPPTSDVQLFRAAMRDVTPLRVAQRMTSATPLPAPHPQQRQRDEQQVMHDAMSDHWPWDSIESGEELLYLRAGQKHDTLRRLRRGHWVIQAELDLHGLDSDGARMAVGQFLHQCVRENRRCVRIIHGKGLGSRQREPVPKHKLRNWLLQRDEVLAYCQARPVDGGAGAVLVLLRGPKARG